MKLDQVNSREKREEYRLQMVELQRQANVYRQAIDRFDKSYDDAKRAAILGKCYRDTYVWFRIEGFDDDFSPYGTKILQFSDDNETLPNYQIETNSSIWEDDIQVENQISNEEFNTKLKEVVSYISNVVLSKS